MVHVVFAIPFAKENTLRFARAVGANTLLATPPSIRPTLNVVAPSWGSLGQGSP